MAVKFLKSCQQGALYNEGEIAGFDKETEARLIKQGFAESWKKLDVAVTGKVQA